MSDKEVVDAELVEVVDGENTASGTIKISVKTKIQDDKEKTIALDVKLSDTIVSVKTKLQDQIGGKAIAPKYLHLFLDDARISATESKMELEDGRTLSECSIQEESTLLLEIDLIYEGETWDYCCFPCYCLTPLICSQKKWTITKKRVDYIEGFCGSSEQTIDIRRIKDMELKRSILQMCLGRGTIILYVTDVGSGNGQCEINMSGARAVYRELKEAWTEARVATAVDASAE